MKLNELFENEIDDEYAALTKAHFKRTECRLNIETAKEKKDQKLVAKLQAEIDKLTDFIDKHPRTLKEDSQPGSLNAKIAQVKEWERDLNWLSKTTTEKEAEAFDDLLEKIRKLKAEITTEKQNKKNGTK